MQVHKIQNNTPSYRAKLNITGEEFYGEVFEKMFDKASKIGTEKDVIDIKYVGNFSPVSSSKNSKFTGTFVGKFIPKGNKNGGDKARVEIKDSTRFAYRERAKKAAVEFIDTLYSKYVK